LRRVDLQDVGLEDFDAGAAQAAAICADLGGAAGAGHDPQQRRRELKRWAAVDDHDPIGVIEPEAQAAGGDQPAGAASEDDNGAVSDGGPPCV